MRHRELENQPAEPRLFGRPAYDRSALVGPASAARWLLVFILLAGAYFFHGFLVPVLAAVVIGFASWPLYRRLLVAVNGNRTIGATIAIILVVAFIVTPVTFAAIYAVDEFRGWVGWAVEANSVGADVPAWVLQLPLGGAWLGVQWAKYVGHPGALGELVQLVSGSNIGSIYRGALVVGAGAARSLLTLLFMLITLFFVYRDGEKFVAQLDKLGERILPMRWERVSRIVPLTISSTVTGMGLIAIGEGLVLGVAYWIAGVPSPVTLGIITGFMALIPGGAPLCFTLVSVYLLASGAPVAGFALFAWGTIELFIVDKTLRPRLVGGPIKLPFLPTFFGLVGGVKTMGFLGLFVGPVLMALIVAIWREWLHEVTTPAPEQTAKLIKQA
ncbi:AI-2E family transporter [Ferranicluibacter rubi]|uniref:AI-2E family transporter n=1 Tax=Ferranicluibacter rubi TaxID=2715133 RepID=A0AA43ZC50_9HYPH|nr:AI-2E family transporter [Ferranicluibacter rubi]TCP89320.1 putative PurR-regulated permease PerM [Rhizobium sp. PP-CC-2G-626]TCQ11814.1 putative PurR-regulated permease PerM [Rhizobium sp. PP-F2F-G36]TCQ29413.1 putative PurR-regulated permease PerM [Rhizobium sp. PP-CC-3G-465]